LPATPNPSTLSGYAINATDPNLKYPSVWKTDIAIDRKLPFGFVATAEFIFNKNIQALRYIDANLRGPDRTFAGSDTRGRFPASGVPTAQTAASRFINPQIGNAFVLKNYQGGQSSTMTLKIEKPVVKGLGGMFAYTRGMAKDMQSVGSTVQANMPTTQGQNYLGIAFADNDLRHRFIGYVNYRIEYGGDFGGATSITLGGTANSGPKFSYISGSDLNGDGQINDLLYIPSNASELTFVANGANSPAAQAAAFDAYVDGDEYLSSRRGNYTERNAGELPWLTRFDLTIAQDFFIRVGSKGKKNAIQVRLDIMNFGNMLNNKWGVAYSVVTANPLSVATGNGVPGSVNNSGINAAGVPLYRLATQTFPQADGTTVSALIQDRFTRSINLNNAWQAQLGLRYTFN
jgi:hypothetical protein